MDFNQFDLLASFKLTEKWLNEGKLNNLAIPGLGWVAKPISCNARLSLNFEGRCPLVGLGSRLPLWECNLYLAAAIQEKLVSYNWIFDVVKRHFIEK